MTSLLEFLAGHPILLIFVLIGAGMALGSVRIRGISMGAAAVLFLGIGISAAAAAADVEATLPPILGTLGLALFAFGIGNNSGVTFFQSLRSAAGPVFAMVGVFIIAAIVTWAVGSFVLDLDIAVIAGTFAGAITNTPALAAASEATGESGPATVGYAVAYLFGVIGMMIATVLVLRRAGDDDDTTAPVTTVHIQVTHEGFRIGDILDLGDSEVQVTRLRRVGHNDTVLPVHGNYLHPGDVITVVGSPEYLNLITDTVGRASPQLLIEDRHELDFRRITISKHDRAGHTIAQLNNELSDRWGARISRVRRADEDQVAMPEFVVELGDRVRVVGPAESLEEISNFLGDSSKGLTDINPVALGLGLSLGYAIGQISIPLPGGDSFSLGAAAGVLIVALLMAHVGRVGSLITALPHSANTVLAEFGLLLFLAQAGTNAGGQIAEAFTGGAWIKILLLGFIITTIVAVGVVISMRKLLGIGATKTAGVLGGAQTQPAILAFANTRTASDPRVSLGYAMVYPAAMIAKILIAHGLALLG
ncbi:MAG: TrkA C-terminal domain-containing protein [Corynebacterium camporealensis]|uniref:aspartate:alanine exchanger family transporter n=1 Tax=Corynebacterium camporealensis TaxID=161896 RepID=UPI002A917A68|nr:TrkA C-terminal domain-containing protein [Corynebacterium camporealensis]MDY5839497.1 TrkA C-terminal domain-containing protein [Corynebacterium camporealensis]